MNQPVPDKSVGRKQLLGLFAIAAISTFVPYIMYVTGWGIPDGTKNKGVLISQPTSVSEFDFQLIDGNRWSLTEQEAKFRLVYLLDGDCDEVCEELLYRSRQVHIRLGRDTDKLERLIVWLGSQPPSSALLEFFNKEHTNAKVLLGDRRQWLDTLALVEEASAQLDGHEYYLLHRYSALVMLYNDQQAGNELLEDIKFLIKTSN